MIIKNDEEANLFQELKEVKNKLTYGSLYDTLTKEEKLVLLKNLFVILNKILDLWLFWNLKCFYWIYLLDGMKFYTGKIIDSINLKKSE